MLFMVFVIPPLLYLGRVRTGGGYFDVMYYVEPTGVFFFFFLAVEAFEVLFFFLINPITLIIIF